MTVTNGKMSIFSRIGNSLRREFPEIVEEIEAFGQAAGLSPEEAYFAHILTTTGVEGCSLLAMLKLDEGPVMLRCLDSVQSRKCS